MSTKIIFIISAFSLLASHGIMGQSYTELAAISSASSSGYAGFAFDSHCNMYATWIDHREYNVVKIDAVTGTQTVYAGSYSGSTSISGFSGNGGPATSAQLGILGPLAIDASDNLYIADITNSVVWMVAPVSGDIHIVAGNGTSGYSGDTGPATSAKLDFTASTNSIAINPVTNDLYIDDYYNNVVRVVNNPSSLSGNINVYAGTVGTSGLINGAATSAELNGPFVIAFDASGNLYISDYNNNVIRMVNYSTGIISTFAGTGSTALPSSLLSSMPVSNYNFPDGPYGMAIDKTQTPNILYCSFFSLYTGGIYAINLGTNSISSSAGIFLSSLTIDNGGNLFGIDGSGDMDVYEACTAPAPSPSVTVTIPATTICSGIAPTFTADVTGVCGVSYSWYKSPGTGLPFTLAAYTTTNNWTDYAASNGEQVYCVVSISSALDFCNTGPYTSNTVTIAVANLQIADVDINTLCAPGTTFGLDHTLPDAPLPVYSVTVTGGSGDYAYSWNAQTDNNATLSSDWVQNPTVTTVTSPMTADFILWVTDLTYHCHVSRQVVTHFNTNDTFDLASRDGYYDMFDELNSQSLYNAPASGDYWSSPDIVNRLHPDGGTVNEPPVYFPVSGSAHPNYVYVKIRNVGCMNYHAVDVGGHGVPTLNVYWTMGGAGGDEVWSGDWTTNYACSTYPAGGEIYTAESIPAINAGSSIIFPSGGISWTPPAPGTYASTCLTPLIAPDDMSLCLLSRIVDFHNNTIPLNNPPGMTFLETVDPGPNTVENNNIVALNTGVIDMSSAASYPATSPVHRYVGVGSFATAPYSLQIINSKSLNGNIGGASILNNYASFKVYLGAALFDAWQTAGGYGTYTTVNYTDKSVTFDGTNTVQLDSIPIDSGANYQLHIAAYALNNVSLDSMPAETINFRELSDTGVGRVCGNFSYLVKHKCTPYAKGVLAVTELSQGPALDDDETGCEYAEMIVANGGDDASLYVDVSGWIIDDNSDNFDTVGCVLNGTTKGHYRLAPNSPIWQAVPVGSVIVAYNGEQNCYNLPSSFTWDTANRIFWIPIYSDTTATIGQVIQRFAATENTGSSDICSDTGSTVYTAANAWSSTIALAAMDAIQVRCPGCTSAYPGTPPFYTGMGYAPDTTYCFVTIPAGTGSLGGPVEYNPNSDQKYVFTGSAAADFADPTKWSASLADAAGSPPSTLGNVNPGLYTAVVSRSLGLPACSYGGGGERTSAPGEGTTAAQPIPNNAKSAAQQGIRVYPNPANMSLYFVYPLSSTVTIKLMDITGRIMDEQILQNSSNTSFNVHGYTPGLYMYQVITNGVTRSGKFVVQ